MYIGRFAPSPTGLLHAGSLVAALASWLDARAHGGQWLVRIEDVDTPRCIAGADHAILAQLAACGLHPDAPPVWQSQRTALYQSALDTLVANNLAYRCACSRKDIEAALHGAGLEKPRNGELVYPGTCRHLAPAERKRRIAAGREHCVRLDSALYTGYTFPHDYDSLAGKLIVQLADLGFQPDQCTEVRYFQAVTLFLQPGATRRELQQQAFPQVLRADAGGYKIFEARR